MSQDGHFCRENTKTAALALAGIPCASAPLFAEHSQEILIVVEEKCSDE